MSGFSGFDFYSDRPDKAGELMAGWNVHKTNVDVNSRRVTKFEQYRFMPESYWPSLEAHLLRSKRYRYLNDPKFFPRIFNVMLSARGKVLNAKLKPPSLFEHSYITHFARVVEHRGRPYLLRAYQCVSRPNGQVKFEITYLEDEQQGIRSIRGLRNPLYKLAAMKEYKNRIDRQLKLDPMINYIDHTGGRPVEIYVEELLHKAKLYDHGTYQRMLKFLESKKFKSKSDLF